jgi:enediyne biosynthesis protein CalE5
LEANQINPTEFRDGQRKSWNKASTAWGDKWLEKIDSSTRHISERLVELAGVERGSRALDVAAGAGEPTLSAARKAGPEGSVVATDISPEMLAFARKRAEAEGLGNIEFVESAAIDLTFDPQSFDAAVSRWGIIFDPDGEGAAARVKELLRPGSRFAISSWGPPERVPFLAVPMGTVMSRLEIPPPAPGTPGPLSRPTPEALGGLLEGGGFSEIEIEEAEVVFEVSSPFEFTEFMRDMAPPITALMADRPQEVQDETWEAITDAAAEHADDSGTVRMTNLVLLASGEA